MASVYAFQKFFLIAIALLQFFSISAASSMNISGIITNNPPEISGIFAVKSSVPCTAADFNSGATSVSSFLPTQHYLCIRIAVSDSSGNQTISLADSNIIISTPGIISSSVFPPNNNWNFIKITTSAIGFVNCSSLGQKATMSNSDAGFCAQLSPDSVSISLSDINSCNWSIKATVQDSNKESPAAALTLASAVSFSTTIPACGSTTSTETPTNPPSNLPSGEGGKHGATVEKGKKTGETIPLVPSKKLIIIIKTNPIGKDEIQKIIVLTDKNIPAGDSNVFIINPLGKIEKFHTKNGTLEMAFGQEGEYDVIAISKDGSANSSFRVVSKLTIGEISSPGKIAELSQKSPFLLWLLCIAVFITVFAKSGRFFARKSQSIFDIIDESSQKTILSLSWALIPLGIDLIMGRSIAIAIAFIEIAMAFLFFGKTLGFAEKLSPEEKKMAKSIFLETVEKIEKNSNKKIR